MLCHLSAFLLVNIFLEWTSGGVQSYPVDQVPVRDCTGGTLSEDDFQRWLCTEVIDIVTDKELAVAKTLRSDEDRCRFVQGFWRQREQSPNSDHNEFRDRHYGRVWYANYQFATKNKLGSETDRGRIVIKLGVPDRVQLSGPDDRFGRPYGFPFERWYYEKVMVNGVPTTIELEFADPALRGEYRLVDDMHGLLRKPCPLAPR